MPSPWIIRSVARPVVWAAPWLKLVLVAASWTPRPTWMGLLPPRFTLALDAAVSIWLNVSWKTVEEDLKPVVFALAMLLPVTSSMVWLTRRPLMPAKSERSMVLPCLSGDSGGAGVAGGDLGQVGRAVPDGADGGHGDVLAVDLQHGPLGLEPDRA